MYNYNSINKEVLKSMLYAEKFSRMTISFYRYFLLSNTQILRVQLYQDWSELNCFSRIYLAKEGVNAQMSISEDQQEAFLYSLKKYSIFDQIPIRYAVEDDGKSFYKLTIKVHPKLVADGLNGDTFDVTNVTKYPNPYHSKLFSFYV